MVDRKILRCKRCNHFLGAMNVADYLTGSKVMVELEFRCCKCGSDNVYKLQIAPVIKKEGLPYF